MEKWHIISRYPVYEISETLQVRHRVFKQIKKFYTDGDGYLRSNMQWDNKKDKPRLHQLVGWTFVPNPENKPELHHIDTNKLNNHWTNLMWVTRQEHAALSKLNGQYAHKVKPADIVFIRDNFWGLGKEFLANKFSISVLTVIGIASGRERKDILHPATRGISNLKPVIDIQTGIYYENAQELCELIGMKPKDLTRRLCGERPNNTQYRYAEQSEMFKLFIPTKKPLSPIGVFNLKWEFIRKFDYTGDAEVFTGSNRHAINAVVKGKQEFSKGYKFKKIDKDGNFIEPIPFVSKRPLLKPKKIKQPNTPSKPLIQFDINGNKIAEYQSIGHVAREFGVDKHNFKKMINKSQRSYYKGFIWKYA